MRLVTGSWRKVLAPLSVLVLALPLAACDDSSETD
jgi:hypothetical protein